MAREHRVGGRNHRYTGTEHTTMKGYNTTNAPEVSTANKIDPGKHHTPQGRTGIGGGHGVSHMGRGENRAIQHGAATKLEYAKRSRARTGY